MLSGKLPTGTVGAGDEADRARRRPNRGTARSGTDRQDGRRSTGTDRERSAAGTASANAETATGTATTTPRAGASGPPSEMAAGTATPQPPPTGTTDATATPQPTGGRRQGPPASASAENSRLRRRLSDERAERQAVIDHYERLLSARTEAAADCGEGTEPTTQAKTRAKADANPGDARAWLRRAISRLRIAWSRRG